MALQVLKPVMRRLFGDEIESHPYIRVPTDGRRYASVLPEATHADLGSRGSRRIQAYIATNSRLFFDMYLGGDESARDEIGRAQWIEGIDHRRK